MMIYTKY